MSTIYENETMRSTKSQRERRSAGISEKHIFDLDVGREGIATQEVNLDNIDAKEERAFLWRLDLGFLTIGFLGYMFKYLDQINISNAYVSGMQEDLNLTGDELNYFTTYFK